MSFSFRERPHGSQHFSRIAVSAGHHTIERQLRFIAPMPGILERFDLCAIARRPCS
jgi:hypothetical protein